MNSNFLSENGIQSPLLIEIANLKAALGRYQTAADTANLHLQRQALDSSTLTARCAALEQDNALLQAEIQLLRSIPDSNPSIAGIQVSELSLALRHVQDQYRLSEEELKNVHEKLGLALKAKARAMYEVEGMEELVRSTRGREEELRGKIRELEGTVRRCLEEKKMVEMCVREYADLVRGLEGRLSSTSSSSTNAITGAGTGTNGLVLPEESVHSLESSTSGSSGVERSQTPSTQSQPYSHSPSHSPSPSQAHSHSRGHSRTVSIILSGNTTTTTTRPIDSLQEGRMGLQRLLGEFHSQTGKLEEEIARLHGELEMMEMRLEQREKLGLENERETGKLKGELMAAARADKSASIMVEKYMSFSQQSTNLLQTALQTQKQRHAGTVSTLTSQIANLTRAIERERSVSDKLRETLDELTLEISKESFGRRREISLRLALMERETKVGRMIEWWIGTIERGKDSMAGDAGRGRAVDRAKAVLSLMRGVPVGVERTEGGDEERMMKIILDCQELERELGQEMEKRMELERRLAKMVGRESFEQSARTASLDGDEPEEPMAVDVTEPNVLEQEEETLLHNGDASSPVQQTTPLAAPSNQPATLDEQPLPEAYVPSSIHDPASDSITITESEPAGKYADMIKDLQSTANRYDSIQSSFTDCHNALSDLRSAFNSTLNGEMSTNDVVGSNLVAAVQRLDDYCEDARVELEILIADEARISHGYETLLSLSSGNMEQSSTKFQEDELLKKMDRFISGTEPSIERARVVFGEKLDNLMHDIAIIKKEMHDRINPSSIEDSESTRESSVIVPVQSEGDEHDSRGDLKAMSTRNESGIWKTLTSSMLSPSTLTPRSSSPNPRPVPTFGSLMTSGRPRPPPTHDQSSSPDSNPLNRLGLRIAMPNKYSQGTAYLNIHSPFPFGMNSPDYQPPGNSGGGEIQPNSAPLSRVGSGWFGTGGMVRARTMSSIHVPGFGVGMGMTPVTPKGMSQLGRPVSRSGSEAGIMVQMNTARASSVEGGMVKDQEEVE